MASGQRELRQLASRAIAIRIVLKVSLKDRLQHNLGRIPVGWNAERTLAFSIRGLRAFDGQTILPTSAAVTDSIIVVKAKSAKTALMACAYSNFLRINSNLSGTIVQPLVSATV